MGISFSFGWETSLIVFLQKFMSGIVVKAAGLITEFGDATILVGIIGLFYWSLNKKLGRRLLLYLGTVNIINPCIKSSVRRLRPYMTNPEIKCLKPVSKEGDIYDVVTQEFSFPSGHSCNSMAVYGSLAAGSRKLLWRLSLITLVLFVGISRFALGVHYPTDVLSGWLIGFFSVFLADRLENRLGRDRAFLLLSLLGLAGFFVARTNDFYTGYGLLLGSGLALRFEEKYVRFEETRSVPVAALRTLVGIALYLGLNSLLKLPFSAEFLSSGTLPAFLVRAARYTLLCFLLLGVYPLSFRCFGGKKTAAHA